MQKTILITGATDGIGKETAKMLASLGHNILLHGRNADKLKDVKQMLSVLPNSGSIEIYKSDLSRLSEVKKFAEEVIAKHAKLDVLINNAGVYNAANPLTEDGLDIRFAVNTIAPYLLTQQLLPLLKPSGRVINLSSAAQSPVDLNALEGKVRLADNVAYAQSKLALTMWSRELALSLADDAVIVAINPGSMLGSKMVKNAYGVDGGDLRIGAKILTRAALEDEFSSASGKYFDNDKGQFSSPHPDALNANKSQEVINIIKDILN